MSKVEMNQKQMYNISVKSDMTLKVWDKKTQGEKKHHPEYTFQKLLQDILIAQSHVDLSISPWKTIHKYNL